jgi:hypothetical protein
MKLPETCYSKGGIFLENTEVIPFRLNCLEGRVTVSYGKNEDPKQTGFDYLAEHGLEKEFDFSQCVGFPVMRAKVSYAAEGYRALFGWIQVVTAVYRAQEKTMREIIHDKYPSYQDIDFPFGSFGFLPSFYDAPATWNPQKRKNYTWQADTFLTTFPVLSRENEEIRWICGFKWGYYFDDDPTLPKIAPFTITKADSWNEILPFLRDRAKTWRFKEATGQD